MFAHGSHFPHLLDWYRVDPRRKRLALLVCILGFGAPRDAARLREECAPEPPGHPAPVEAN